MYQDEPFSIFSETGPLKQVMLHRPGNELNRLTICNMEDLLFDDLIWLEQAQREHNKFADLLRASGSEVLYFADCLADILKNKDVRTSLIEDVLSYECLDRRISAGLTEYFTELVPKELASLLIEGYSKEEASHTCSLSHSLISNVSNGTEFLIHPIPNLYFQRDPAITVANGIIIGQMMFEARRKEPIYWK